jgi:hypothetical protein
MLDDFTTDFTSLDLNYDNSDLFMVAYNDEDGGLRNSQNEIKDTCDEVKRLLLEKNRKYGDAALSPVRIFSKANSAEQLRVRIDDKLSRIANGALDEDEDPLLDLIGYLVLLKISMNRQ